MKSPWLVSRGVECSEVNTNEHQEHPDRVPGCQHNELHARHVALLCK